MKKYSEFVNEAKAMKVEKPKNAGVDLSTDVKSFTFKLEKQLIPFMDKMSTSEIKKKFIELINADDYNRSEEYIRKTLLPFERPMSKTEMMKYITSIYLTGSNLSMRRLL